MSQEEILYKIEKNTKTLKFKNFEKDIANVNICYYLTLISHLLM